MVFVELREARAEVEKGAAPAGYSAGEFGVVSGGELWCGWSDGRESGCERRGVGQDGAEGRDEEEGLW